MTMLGPNGCPEHRGSHCEADQAPPSTQRAALAALPSAEAVP
jgi:hypothetical protein